MEAKELRTGNYVEHQLSKDVIIINGADIFHLSGGMDDDIFQPIPLTEEWLLKFGFENHMDSEYTISISGDKFYLYKLDRIFSLNIGRGLVVRYVHQLQNLYFALTNKELKINETIKS